MAGGNGLGPLNLGPRTGRGLGFCAGYPMPGYMNCGFGRGRGFGRGFRWRMQPPIQPIQPMQQIQPVELTKEEQKKILEAELKDLEAEKQEIEKELKKLKS